MASLLVTEVGGPITHPPLQQSHHNSTSNEKPTKVSFKKKKPTHVSTNPSLSTNQNLLSLLNGPVNSSTYTSLLESCKCPKLGTQIHAHTLKSGFCGHEFIETRLLQMYGRCGCVEHSTLVFEKMPQRSIYSWAGILTVYTDNRCFEEALLLFRELQFEDICLEFFVFPVVLKACSGFSALELGRQVDGMVIKNQFISNMYVGNALLDMYGKCGSVDDAKKLLAKMPERDCVSWNSVVTGCAANGLVFEALEVQDNMGSVGNLMPNLVSWSAVIGGFAQNGYDKEALQLLYRMQEAGFKPNARTLASVLPACARLQALSIGKEIHRYITRNEFMFNPFVVNGLVDVYRRCADMISAMNIFSKFSVRNLVSIKTMIVGYCWLG